MSAAWRLLDQHGSEFMQMSIKYNSRRFQDLRGTTKEIRLQFMFALALPVILPLGGRRRAPRFSERPRQRRSSSVLGPVRRRAPLAGGGLGGGRRSPIPAVVSGVTRLLGSGRRIRSRHRRSRPPPFSFPIRADGLQGAAGHASRARRLGHDPFHVRVAGNSAIATENFLERCHAATGGAIRVGTLCIFAHQRFFAGSLRR